MVRNRMKDRGIIRKYNVSRVNGEVYDGEEFFVLSTRDKFSRICLETYANVCEDDGYKLLAKELREMAQRCK